MRETFHAADPRSWWMRTHAQTAGWTLTAQQPENNVIRVALQALAAILGGTQSLHTNSMDEAWALPSEDAALLALRTQQIIAHETGVTDTVDPLGGSYFVEALTKQVEEGAYDYFRRIEDVGGVIPAIESGYLQREIANAAYNYQQEMDRNEMITVGVNDYVSETPPDIPLLRVDREGEERQIRRLNELRRRRDNRDVKEKLLELERAARGSQNVMPPLLEAVKAYATLGEAMDVFRGVFGEYQPSLGLLDGGHDMALKRAKVRFNYQDYCQLPEGKRYEIMDGEIYVVPSPGFAHQNFLGNLFVVLRDFVMSNNLGIVVIAPFDVILSEEDVVQPDLVSIARDRREIITRRGCEGPPDLAVEVHSELVSEVSAPLSAAKWCDDRSNNT